MRMALRDALTTLTGRQRAVLVLRVGDRDGQQAVAWKIRGARGQSAVSKLTEL